MPSATTWATKAAGDFVTSFVLDDDDETDVLTPSIAPGGIEWIRWPHAPLSEGMHFVRCVLDPDNDVSTHGGRRAMGAQFEVTPVEFPPQDVYAEAGYDKAQLFKELIDVLRDRINLWVVLSVQAIERFEGPALQRIDDLDWDGDTDADADLPPSCGHSRASCSRHVPGVGQVLGVVKEGVDLLALLKDELGNGYRGEAGAKAQLRRAVTELKEAAHQALLQSIEGYDDRLIEHLSPRREHSPLRDIEWGSSDPGYLNALSDWLGVPQPTVGNTERSHPVRTERRVRRRARAGRSPVLAGAGLRLTAGPLTLGAARQRVVASALAEAREGCGDRHRFGVVLAE